MFSVLQTVLWRHASLICEAAPSAAVLWAAMSSSSDTLHIRLLISVAVSRLQGFLSVITSCSDMAPVPWVEKVAKPRPPEH